MLVQSRWFYIFQTFLYEQSELLTVPSLLFPLTDNLFLLVFILVFIQYPTLIYHIAGTMPLGLSKSI